MDALPLEDVVRNFDLRFDRTEQFLPTLATKAELRAEVQAESAETRRYMKVLVEDLRDDIRIMTEGLVALDARDARQHAERMHAQAGIATRVTSLEAGRRSSRPR